MLGMGVEEPKPPAASPQVQKKDPPPKPTWVIDTTSMSPSEAAFQRQRARRAGATPEFVEDQASVEEVHTPVIEPIVEEPVIPEQKTSSMASEEIDIRQKLGLSPKSPKTPKTTPKVTEEPEAVVEEARERRPRSVAAARRQSTAPSLLERASDFFEGLVSTVQRAAQTVINKAKEIGEKVQSFFQDIRQNGVKPLFESVKESMSRAVAVLSDPSRLSAAVGRTADRLNEVLKVVPDRVHAFVQALNDRLYGIKRDGGKGSGSASESRYWKELTGMSRSQFLLALRKDRDRLLLFGSMSSQGIDFNAGRAAKQGRTSESTGLAKIRVVDLLRGNFQGVYHLRMFVAQKIAQKIVDGPFGEGTLTGSVLERAIWLQELLAAQQAALSSNIVDFHEAYVSGTSFAETYKENDSWTQRYFSPEGSGRSYSELHHAYREAILQKYFNFSLVTASVLFVFVLLRRRARHQLAQQQQEMEHAAVASPEASNTYLELQKLRLEVEKLKLER